MLKRILVWVLVAMLVLLTSICTSCSSSKSMKHDTPDKTLLSLSLAISGNNYNNFNTLFSEGRKDTVSKEALSEFSISATGGIDNCLYGLITYSNGEMFLAKLSVKKIDGEYKIEDVVKVPEEMKKLFRVK